MNQNRAMQKNTGKEEDEGEGKKDETGRKEDTVKLFGNTLILWKLAFKSC